MALLSYRSIVYLAGVIFISFAVMFINCEFLLFYIILFFFFALISDNLYLKLHLQKIRQIVKEFLPSSDTTSVTEPYLQMDQNSLPSDPLMTVIKRTPTKRIPDTPGPIPVIILTYMRSGSSFTGEILQAGPNTFYWFEPLYKLKNLMKTNSRYQLRFLDGRKRVFMAVAGPTIASICTCQFDQTPLEVLTDDFIQKGKKAKEFIKCLRSFRPKMPTDIMLMRKCVPVFQEKCIQSSHVVVKTIRMSMETMENLLKNIPRLKILHLIRDPRGTTWSQKCFGVYQKLSLRENITNFCGKILNDIQYKEQLKEIYPNRIRTVYYEELAKNPIEYAKTLYKFLEMEFTSETEMRIFNMTSSGAEAGKCGPLCTHSANSSLQAYEWRDDVSFEFTKIVDESCTPLYDKVGYLPIPNEDLLRDRSFKVRL